MTRSQRRLLWAPLLALLSATALAAALALVAHHPLSAGLALAAVLVVALGSAACPQAWLIALPALLPWLGLAPWSGWIMVEETDLLVLAVVAGAYAGGAWRAWQHSPAPAERLAWGPRVVGGLLFAFWAASVVLGLQRGIADAGGMVWDWYQAYRGPMNALRLAKPTLAVALLLPLWWQALGQGGELAARRLTVGLVLAHAGIALACLWERAAFPGLLNFSADYRSTGPFWEMHVGGAPLDGLLALTLPFVLMACIQARSRLAWLLAAATLLLGSYAILTTFSRILLLAAPLAVAVALGVWWRGQGRAAPGAQRGSAAPAGVAAPRAAIGMALLLWLAVSLAAAVMFPSSGYRGLLALLGNAALLLMVAPLAHRLQPREWAAAVALALAGAPVLLAAAVALPKGPYLLQPLLWAGVAALVLLARGSHTRIALALAGWLVALAGMVLLAQHWGGGPALVPAAAVAAAAVLTLIVTAVRRPPPWPAQLRWQGGVWLAMAVSAAVTCIFVGGAYMAGRLDATAADRVDRFQHFRDGLAALPDGRAWWLGQGLGRFADSYALAAGPGHRPGDLRWAWVDGQRVMRMAPGTHLMGFGELLRLSQRIARPQQALTLRATLRSPEAALLHAEVCIKHLLYSAGCQGLELRVTAGNADWQTVSGVLVGEPLPVDAWPWVRFTVFSLAVEHARLPVELGALHLTDAQGRDYLHNPGFQQGGQRWFFSSDMHHLPWHAKNAVVHLLFEQGWLGLAAMAALSACALWRVTLGGARRHALAPALAGALAGVWAVGAVDSLFDMPRLALMLLLLTMVAATLPAPALATLPAGPANRA